MDWPAAGVMVSGAGAMMTAYVSWTAAPPLSVAVTVKVNGPAVVGVPLSVPSAARFRPGGRVPDVNWSWLGPVPALLTVRVWLYGTPYDPPGSCVSIVTVYRWLPNPARLLAVTVKVKVPAALGVPLSTPAVDRL